MEAAEVLRSGAVVWRRQAPSFSDREHSRRDIRRGAGRELLAALAGGPWKTTDTKWRALYAASWPDELPLPSLWVAGCEWDREKSFFDGIDEGLRHIQASVHAATKAFRADRPEVCAPSLADGSKETDSLIEKVRASNLSEQAKYDVLHELEIKQAQFNNALIEALGVSLRATVRSDTPVNALFALFMGDPDTFRIAIPGQQFGVQVSVTKQAGLPVELKRVSLESPSDAIRTVKEGSAAETELRRNQEVTREFRVQAAESAGYTRPSFTRPSIQQPYYNMAGDGDPNVPLPAYLLNAVVELTYAGLSLRTSQVVQTVHRETGFGVVYEPLVLGPAISVNVNPRSGIVPLTAKSFRLSVTVHSNVKGSAEGLVHLNMPAGWKSIQLRPPSGWNRTAKIAP